MHEEVILSMKNITVQYGSTTVLDDVSIDIHDHDSVGIIGPNGGGKTTLLKVMLGLVTPVKGEVTIRGLPVEKGLTHVGYVPQRENFLSDFPISVMDVVMMGRYPKRGMFKRYTAEDKELAMEALRYVDMAEYAHRQIGQLSGGQQQRVFIARAIACDPEILLLDEPTSSIDPVQQNAFYEMLKDLNKKMAVIIVSHDISAISVNVEEIVCLNRTLHYHGSSELTEEILEDTYQCPLQFISHGHIPHRVLKEHDHV